jgi:hypothetical protein
MGMLSPGSGNAPFSSLAPVTFDLKDTFANARACVMINGQGPYPIKRFTIDKNCHGATNTASFDVPYAGNPDWTNQLFEDPNKKNTPIYIAIYAGFPASPWITPSISGLSRRFYGVMDEYDPKDLDQTHFQCRSIAAPLTTDRITTQIQNLTTVDFLKQICASYNIPVVVDPALTSPFTLAQVYAQEYIVGLKNLVKWDVLQRSSIFDDVDVWEDDGTVYYVHPWNVSKVVPISKALPLTYGTSIKSFEGKHASQFSRSIQVLVHSYRAKTRVSTSWVIDQVVGGVAVQGVTKVSTSTPQWGTAGGSRTVYAPDGKTTHTTWTQTGGPSSGSTTPISESGKEVYNLYIPNLTPTQCQQVAMQIWRQISMHEYIGEFDLAVTPANLPYLNIESRPAMTGYGQNAFNTLYWPRTMSETFEGPSDENSSEATGWSVKFSCVNHTLPLGGGV